MSPLTIKPTLDFELSLWKKGHKRIVGIDEVGRGSWAGPLVAAGVILPPDFIIPTGLADSKQVKPRLRQQLADFIKEKTLDYTIEQISPKLISKLGLAKTTNMLFRKIATKLQADFCLIDAFYIKHFAKKRQLAIKSGDAICASIAAASIVAKVYRDSLMKKLHFKYPQYGFGKHKGYGTKLHQEAIKNYGFLPIHRTSYSLNFLLNE